MRQVTDLAIDDGLGAAGLIASRGGAFKDVRTRQAARQAPFPTCQP
jgi:hypothetical protein